MKKIDLAFSPCPNDTFIFHAMLHGLVETGPWAFNVHMHDVEYLNKRAAEGAYDVTKLSFYSYLHLKEGYNILSSGSALGFGCGPLLVKGKSEAKIKDMTVAIPGRQTTAFLLLQLWNPEITKTVETGFDRIIDGVASGEFDAGLIIHEGRFIYRDRGLQEIVDLGQWWEDETGSPIPLGCIAARRDTPEKLHHDMEKMIRESILYGRSNKDASRDYIKAHAQEMDDSVIDNHIGLYVNDFSLDLGEKGRHAIETLEEMAKRRNLL